MPRARVGRALTPSGGPVRHLALTVAALSAVALAITGCGRPAASPNATTTGSAAGPSVKACMVLDIGGVDDKSFNQSSWAGMQAAQLANSNLKTSYVASNTSNDYTPNL